SGNLKNKKLKNFKFTNNNIEKQIDRLYKIVKLIKVSKNDTINLDLLELQKSKKYYKGIKFTFFARGVRGEIASGGRYILKNTNKTEEAIGYTCYMDTVVRASSFKNKNKIILIQFNINSKIEKSLIKKGYTLFKTFDEKLDIKKQAKKFGIMYYLSNKMVKKI
ncbi:ATP phosphoribosyltransferase regulatory subunit, partial [Pelagibacteraceae bacterium]|nr:ATP phosphoribosyltransferase regulatory subunit [Pelagibacteraceae bacterium]